MTEIAREAGVSAGALQHHYGSKDILITRIIDLIFEESKPDGDIWPSVTLPVRQRCWRRFKIEPPCRLNFEPGLLANL